MTAKEFAERYVGCTISFGKNYYYRDNDGTICTSNGEVGRCVGYGMYQGDISVLIEANETAKKLWTPDVIDSYTTIVLSKNNGHLMFFNVNTLLCPKEPKINIKPYPHICKLCSAPARKCIGFILCSNLQCKSKKQRNNVLPKHKKESTTSGDNIIRCKICYGVAITAKLLRRINLSSLQQASCSNGHQWNIIVMPGARRRCYTKMDCWHEWNGHGWEDVVNKYEIRPIIVNNGDTLQMEYTMEYTYEIS